MDLKDEEKFRQLEESIILTNKALIYQAKSMRLHAWSILANTASIGIIAFTILKLKQIL